MTLNADDELLLNFFFDNIASDATSNLYKKFVDSKSRTIDIGAKSVSNRVSADEGHPVSVSFGDVTAMTNLTWPNGWPGSARRHRGDRAHRRAARRLAGARGVQQRIAGRVVELHRDLSKPVNSPPLFGFRNTGSAWMDQLLALEKTGTFRKLADDEAAARACERADRIEEELLARCAREVADHRGRTVCRRREAEPGADRAQ
jgi:hypothetical protein